MQLFLDERVGISGIHRLYSNAHNKIVIIYYHLKCLLLIIICFEVVLS